MSTYIAARNTDPPGTQLVAPRDAPAQPATAGTAVGPTPRPAAAEPTAYERAISAFGAMTDSVQDAVENAYATAAKLVGLTYAKEVSWAMDRMGAGGYDGDDPGLAAALAEARLRQLQLASPQQRGMPGVSTSGSGDLAAGGAPTTGGSSAVGGGTPAISPQQAALRVAELEALQAQTRATKLSAEMRARLADGVQLGASLQAQGIDPATFQPTTPQEATAFANLMALRSVEAALQVEIVSTQLRAARLREVIDGAGSGDPPSVTAQGGPSAKELKSQLRAANTEVEKYASIVDQKSDHTLSKLGQQVLDGETVREGGVEQARQLQTALKESGLDESAVKLALGANELSHELTETPDDAGKGFNRVRDIGRRMLGCLLRDMNERAEKRAKEEERQSAERQRDDERYRAKHAERRDAERLAQSRRAESRQQDAAAQARSQAQTHEMLVAAQRSADQARALRDRVA